MSSGNLLSSLLYLQSLEQHMAQSRLNMYLLDE